MKNLRPIVLLLLVAFTQSCARTVNVTSFGAIPDDGKDDAPALREAAAYCRSHRGTTLVMPAGVYDFHDDEAADIQRKAIDGTFGRGLAVQNLLFQPQRPYVIGLDFSGARDLTIKAEGAILNVDGWMQVVNLFRTRNVTIEGLAITSRRPAATEAEVVEVGNGYVEMTYDPDLYTYIGDVVQGRTYFYRPSEQHFVYAGGQMEPLGAGRIRMTSDDDIRLGDVLIIRYGGHYRPCIMVKECTNTTFRDVSIRSFSGMGIVGHMSHDIFIDGLRVVPEPGRYSSTTTDATHFTSCSGDLVLTHCTFAGNGDDCTNVHNYYCRLYPLEDHPEQAEIRIEGADLHAQSLDYPSPGDTMIVVRNTDLYEVGRYRVRRADIDEETWTVVVTFDRPLDLPDNADNYYITNITRFPRVLVENNTVRYHNGRSFLLKAPDVTVRGNTIAGTTLTAIKLGAELSWHEAGPIRRALIEDNYIIDCGVMGGRYTPTAVMVTTECPQTPDYVNRNIIIRNNVIDTKKPIVILLNDAENVVIENNTVNAHNYVQQNNTRNVTISEPNYAER